MASIRPFSLTTGRFSLENSRIQAPEYLMLKDVYYIENKVNPQTKVQAGVLVKREQRVAWA